MRTLCKHMSASGMRIMGVLHPVNCHYGGQQDVNHKQGKRTGSAPPIGASAVHAHAHAHTHRHETHILYTHRSRTPPTPACCSSPPVHPGFSNTSWYFKSDPNAYTISRIIYAVRSRLGPWVRVGQPPQTGAISTVFACVTPQLTGTTSSRQNRGVFDALERAVLGGRLRYFGPSYILQNWNNAGKLLPANIFDMRHQVCGNLPVL